MATKLQAALIAVAQGQTPDLKNMAQADKDLVKQLINQTERPVGEDDGPGESIIKIRDDFSPKKNGVKGDWLCCYFRLDNNDGTIHPRTDGRDARSAVLYGSTRNNLLTVGTYKGHDLFMSLYIGRKLKTSSK